MVTGGDDIFSHSIVNSASGRCHYNKWCILSNEQLRKMKIRRMKEVATAGTVEFVAAVVAVEITVTSETSRNTLTVITSMFTELGT